MSISIAKGLMLSNFTDHADFLETASFLGTDYFNNSQEACFCKNIFVSSIATS